VVIHLGTFSKTLASGLRVAWITAAEEIIDQLALLKQRCDVSSASLEQQVVSHLLRAGHFDRHMQALRVEHRRRYEVMQEALREHLPPGTMTWSPVAGGLYLWVRLGGGIEGHALLLSAAPHGVVFVNGEAFYPDGLGRHELRLCFSSQPPDRIIPGVQRLAQLIAEA
jgi:2-aminoadipate transaminase